MSPRYVLVMLLLVLVPASAGAAVTGWTDVVVRVYDAKGVMTGANLAALDHARRALEAASVDVIWRQCARSLCDAPMRPGELAIRIVRSPVPLQYRGKLPLGEAMLDTRSGAGVLATIYIDRVEWLAREAGADSRVLLGRAIAHELGHLLMATTAHGPVGLMRAMWSLEEVRLGQPRDWSFAPTDLATIRRRAEARQRSMRTWATN